MPARLLALQTDARLLELHRKGDQRAFEAIVLRHRRALVAYCVRLGLSDARAEDAVQQAFLNAWVSIGQGTEIRDVHAWLRRIAHNTALNLMRGAGQDRPVDLDSVRVDAAGASESSLAQTMSAREALADVAALPAMQRDAMVLSAIEGRSHEEVASALGVSPIAVRGLLYRARATLRAGAAALTPAPLFSWVSKLAGRLGGPIASTPPIGGEGFNIARTLLEGAAVVATAAVATGAVLGHSQAHHPVHRQAAVAVTRAASTVRPSIHAGSPRSAHSRAGAQKRSSISSPTGGRATGDPVTRTTLPTRSSPPSRPAVTPEATNPTTSLSAAPGSGSSQPVAGVAAGPGSGAAESPVQSKPTESTGTSEGRETSKGGGSENQGSGDEGERAREAEEEQAEKRTELQEHEAEREREATEHEAERERELAESEAEKAREAREEEADH